MWAAGWAGPIAWFQFGSQMRRPRRDGGHRIVGEYTLHISCAWQWRASSGYVRADENSPPEALWDLSESTPRLVRSEFDFRECLVLKFDNGDTLTIEDVTCEEEDDDDFEYWRLFKPGVLAPHFIVSKSGVVWRERKGGG